MFAFVMWLILTYAGVMFVGLPFLCALDRARTR